MGNFIVKEIEGTNELLFLPSEIDEFDKVSLGMLLNNKIDGILPISLIQYGDILAMKYDVEGTDTLKKLLEEGIQEKKFFEIIRSISHILMRVSDSLIYEEQVVFDENYIFMNSNEDVFLVCVPCGKINKDNSFSQFILDLIERYEAVIFIQDPILEQLRGALNGGNINSLARALDNIIVASKTNDSQKIVLTERKTSNDPYKEGIDLSHRDNNRQGRVILSRSNVENQLVQTTVLDTITEKQKKENTSDTSILQAGENDTLELSTKSDLLKDIDDTMLLTKPQNASKSIERPYLIRERNGEKIIIDRDLFRIGQSLERVNYTITNNKFVSHEHAEIIRTGTKSFVIRDLGSKNHTYVNGRLAESGVMKLLSDNSQITLADEVFTFHIN